jgi:hypothetical protein
MSNRERKQPAPKCEGRKRVGHISGCSSERETAAELGVALRTLRKWRQQGRGPAFIKFARQIHYRDEAVAAWLRAREVNPICEQAAA